MTATLKDKGDFIGYLLRREDQCVLIRTVTFVNV